MGAAERRQKDQHMAEVMKKRGIWHGKRIGPGPYHGSGGLTFKITDVGSAAYRRLMKGRKGKNESA